VVSKLRDSERISRRHEECRRYMKETIAVLEKNVFPLIK